MSKELPNDGEELLRKFAAIPKNYTGRELVIEFINNGHFHSASEYECFALKLPIGETIANYTLQIEPGDRHHNIYAKQKEAEQVLDLPESTVVNAKVRTISGLGDELTGFGERKTYYQGLLIVDIIRDRS